MKRSPFARAAGVVRSIVGGADIDGDGPIEAMIRRRARFEAMCASYPGPLSKPELAGLWRAAEQPDARA